MDQGDWINQRPDGLRVSLKVTPKARKTEVKGLAEDSDGRMVLKLSVTAPPDKGKANEAVLKLLAKEWGLPKSDLAIVLGQTDRHKVILLSGLAKEHAARLTAWAQSRKKGAHATR